MKYLEIQSRHVIKIIEFTKNHRFRFITDANDIEITNCCGNCNNWDEETEEKRHDGDIWRACKVLDNDFCCGGNKKSDAGVIGGGGFRTKEGFFCKYWEIKE